MPKNTNFLRSLQHACNGIVVSIRTEVNLRVHIAVANLICVFAYFYGISRIEWGVLLLAVAFVIVAELVNTAVEQAVDTATHEYASTAKLAKDAAAGAVLAAAVFAVLVGFVLFGDWSKITYTLTFIFTNAGRLIPCLLLGVLDVLLIFFGGAKKKDEE